MAGSMMVLGQRPQNRFLRRAACIRARTAGAEAATGGKVAGVGWLAFQPELIGDTASANNGHGGQ